MVDVGIEVSEDLPLHHEWKKQSFADVADQGRCNLEGDRFHIFAPCPFFSGAGSEHAGTEGKAGSHRGSLQRIFARGQFAGKLSEARRQNSMQIGSDRFPRFLEQLHLCSRSLWGSKACKLLPCSDMSVQERGGVTQFLICRCIGCLRCCCWLSPTIQIMFVHVQQLRYLPKHLGRVSCLVGNTRVSTAVDGNSGEVRPVCRCRTLAFARVYGVWQSRGLEHSSSCLLPRDLPKCTANSGSRCKAAGGREPRSFLCVRPKGCLDGLLMLAGS